MYLKHVNFVLQWDTKCSWIVAQGKECHNTLGMFWSQNGPLSNTAHLYLEMNNHKKKQYKILDNLQYLFLTAACTFYDFLHLRCVSFYGKNEGAKTLGLGSIFKKKNSLTHSFAFLNPNFQMISYELCRQSK